MNYGLEDNQNEKKIQAPKRVKLKKKRYNDVAQSGVQSDGHQKIRRSG